MRGGEAAAGGAPEYYTRGIRKDRHPAHPLSPRGPGKRLSNVLHGKGGREKAEHQIYKGKIKQAIRRRSWKINRRKFTLLLILILLKEMIEFSS